MKKIVLLVDPPRKIEYANLTRHDMEGYTPLEVEKTMEAIQSFTKCSLYTDIEKFMSRLWLHKCDLIFPMVWGRGERNAKAILPAICEAKHIAYIGADLYTHTLCFDKFLAKKYANAFELHTPNGLLLFRSQTDEEIKQVLHYLELPLVIKPNFGGGSCGISCGNLVDTYEDAFQLSKELFENQYNPLLVEEYIAGHEVSVLMLGNYEKIDYCGESQLIIDGGSFFEHQIWGFETKKLDFQRAHYQSSHLLPDAEYEKAKKLFLSLPKAEYLRVDGRLNAQGFYVLELSSDCYLGPNSDFSTLFESMGKTYADFLRFLAENALATQSRRNTPIT